MSRNIDFIMNYPYFIYTSGSKYGYQTASAQEHIYNCNAWPMVFNNPIPRCVSMNVGLYITKDPAYSHYVTNRNWYIYVYRQSYSWQRVGTVYVSEATWAYIDLPLNEINVTKIVAVPSSIPSSYTQWYTTMSLTEMRFACNLNTKDVTANGYFKGVLPNYYGVNSSAVNEVTVNIGGTLTKAKKIYANLGGTLLEIPFVPTGRLQTTNKEDFAVFEFTPTATGNYTFKIKQFTGFHDGYLYDSSFNLLSTDYFSSQPFTLSSGSVYYILIFQFYTSTIPADSVLQVIKEG